MSRASTHGLKLTLAIIMTGAMGCNQASNSISADIEAPSETAIKSNVETDSTSNQGVTAQSTNTTPVSTTSQPSTDTAGTLQPGNYCYKYDNHGVPNAVRLLVNSDKTVSGDKQASAHSPQEDYYAGYYQTFSGTLADDQLQLDVISLIEGDQQQSQEVWTVSTRQLTAKDYSFSSVDCASIQTVFADYDNSSASEEATNIHKKRVQFAAGRTSTLIERGIVRGERDVLLLGAQSGQTMTLDISSEEDNTVFEVVSPNGSILFTESTYEQLTLPEKGDYQVIVGATRGNASYKLYIEIQ